MKNILTPTIPFAISTALTGIGCHLAGMSRPDLIIAIIVAGVISGTVAYGSAFAAARKSAGA